MPHASRRRFLGLLTGAGAMALPGGCAVPGEEGFAELPSEIGPPAQGMSATEYLMRDHALLLRALVIYREALRRLNSGREVPMDSIAQTARIIRRYIEDHHQKLEERYVLPRVQDAGEMGKLVQVLKTQHEAGRRLTDQILELAGAGPLKDDEDRTRLIQRLRAFVRMYEAHAAREDTLVLPAFRQSVSAEELAELGEFFLARQEQVFGPRGYEKLIERIARIEQSLGIHDLSLFTPPP